MYTIVPFLIVSIIGSSQNHANHLSLKYTGRESEPIILTLIGRLTDKSTEAKDIILHTIIFPDDEIINSRGDNIIVNHNNNNCDNKTSTDAVTLTATVDSSKNEVICTDKNERYAIANKCDSYIECRNGVAEEKQCPDGLRYNPKGNTDSKPCVYPNYIECNPGAILQTPQPTADCPNQFGYFKLTDKFNCSSYRICENGTGFDYQCPSGLAFNLKNYRCDWPDQVPQCNVEEYLEYSCPVQVLKRAVSRGYRSQAQCRNYYICFNGLPRLLECKDFFAFDEKTQKCIPANLVEECTKSQKVRAESYVRRGPNGEYIIRVMDDYIIDRSGDISFETNRYKAPQIIF